MASPSLLFSLRTLLPLVPRKEKWRFGGLLVLSLLTACGELALTGCVAVLAAVFGSHEAVLNARFFLWLNQVSPVGLSRDPRYLALTILCVILFFIGVKSLLNIALQWHLTTFSESVGAAARQHIFRFYQRAPFLWITHTGVADLNFGLNASKTLPMTLTTLLQIFINGLMLVFLSATLVSALSLVSMIFLLAFGAGWALMFRRIRKSLDQCSGVAYEVDYATNKISHMALHGLKEMRLYGREKTLLSAYALQLEKNVAARVAQQVIGRLPVISLEVLCFLSLAAVMVFLIYGQNAGIARISGVMGLMAAVAWRSLPAGNRLAEFLAFLRSYHPYLHKVAELVALEHSLNAKGLLALETSSHTRLSFRREIRFEQVSFRYPDSDAGSGALKDISFRIGAGDMVGIIGLSGAGKSTLVNVLTGLVPPDSGEVLVDGQELNRDNVASWLRRIGYVAQTPYILDASLAENVALSRWGEEIDRERVHACCRMAAMEFVDQLDKGIDTILGDRGVRLSGGQVQRVAIARALYSDPDLIIFDEATSSLDMKNETAIHETILSLRGNVTMVVIAHRLHTVEKCDELIWLEKGRIRGMGQTENILKEYAATL